MLYEIQISNFIVCIAFSWNTLILKESHITYY